MTAVRVHFSRHCLYRICGESLHLRYDRLDEVDLDIDAVKIFLEFGVGELQTKTY